MKRTFLMAVVLLSFLGVQSAKGWGRPGHAIIGYVAEQHLTPRAKQMCDHYLRHTLAYEASWMDNWRYCKGFEKTPHWHIGYVYPERQHTGDFRTQIINQESVRKSAAYRINEFHNELRASYKEMPDTLVANKIRFLLHMMGDMHCPAHVAFPVEDNPTYEETTVYNRYRLYNNGKRFSYHSLWDRVTIVLHPQWNIVEWAEAVDGYNKRERKAICEGDANDWLDGIAKEVIRSYGITPRDTDVAKLTEKQRSELEELAYQQFAYAAYRLAYILNDIFKE